MAKGLKKINLRKIGQWGLVLFLAYAWIKTIVMDDSIFNFEACCPFGGIQAISSLFSNGVMPHTMNSLQVLMGAMLALATILFSKLFCGHVCPVGTVSEGLSNLGKRFKLPKYEIGGLFDITLRSLKYILLFVTFYITLGSNELFCQQYDPFYATVTLFGADVTVWMGVLTILILIAGAIFLRHFWCRYLCPLGAISGVFKYFYVFVVFAAILIVFNQADIPINRTWALATICILGYVLEIVGLKRAAAIHVVKIKRNEHACIDCGLCTKNCPQGIQVDKMKVVNHPDCNLCTECIGICPEDKAIGINGSSKFRWLPTLITVVFIMAGFILGAKMEIPTVDLNWGEPEQSQKTAKFQMAGIKNVKCYGSSISFANRMRTVPGVTGVETYIRDHRVVVKYDSTKLSPKDVKKAIFVPTYLDIHSPANEAEVQMVDVRVNNFFDELDRVFIANLVKDIDEVYSMKTIFGEPVKVRFFIDEKMNPDTLKQLIEQVDLVYRTSELSFSSKGRYSVESLRVSDTLFSGLYLKAKSFPAFKRAFNNRNKYSNNELASVVVPITSYPKNQQMMPYIANYLGKSDDFIVGLVSKYTQNGPIAVVFYVREKTNKEKILDLLGEEMITVSYNNGQSETMDNPYVFDISN